MPFHFQFTHICRFFLLGLQLHIQIHRRCQLFCKVERLTLEYISKCQITIEIQLFKLTIKPKTSSRIPVRPPGSPVWEKTLTPPSELPRLPSHSTLCWHLKIFHQETTHRRRTKCSFETIKNNLRMTKKMYWIPFLLFQCTYLLGMIWRSHTCMILWN